MALTGDGGDETFAGYDFRYVPHAMEGKARAFVPGAPGRALAGAVGRAWPRSQALPKWLRAGTVLENLAYDSATAYYADLCFLKPGATRRLLGRGGDDPADSPVFAAITDVYRRPETPDDLQRAQYADLNVYMPNDPLVKVDRMSMAHSLEIRCPFLDRRVVELAFRIPSRRHQQGTTGKVLLQETGSPPVAAGAGESAQEGLHRADWGLDRGAVRGALSRRSPVAVCPRQRHPRRLVPRAMVRRAPVGNRRSQLLALGELGS